MSGHRTAHDAKSNESNVFAHCVPLCGSAGVPLY
jgi:hypothetical protein